MRFNEKELKHLATNKRPTMQGILQYMKPQGSDWSDWYQQPAYKERVFKLVDNFLFYYRAAEQDEPLGVFLLEQMQVAYESPGPAFAFSITFSDGKHIFACRCQEDLNRWVAALKEASYSYWKSLHQVLQIKLARLKSIQGSDAGRNNMSNLNLNGSCVSNQFASNMSTSTTSATKTAVINGNDNAIQVITRRMKKSTFYSQSEVTSTKSVTAVKKYEEAMVNCGSETAKATHDVHNVPVDNLIDL